MNPHEENLKTFINEAHDLVDAFEEILLELEDSAKDEALISNLFRTVHTLKGSSAMYGYDSIAELAHELETLFDHARKGRMELSGELISLSLVARDVMKVLIDAPAGQESPEAVALRARLKALAPSGQKTDEAPAVAAPLEKKKSMVLYHITFAPGRDLYLAGIDPDKIFEELRELGDCRVFAHVSGLPDLDDMEYDKCYLTWDVVVVTDAGRQAIDEAFVFAENYGEVVVQEYESPKEGIGQLFELIVTRILLRRGELKEDVLYESLPDMAAQGAAEPEAKAAPASEGSTIRVPTERLDGLVNMVGELLTIQSSLSQLVSGWNNFDIGYSEEQIIEALRENDFAILTRLFGVSRRLERISEALREGTMVMRMVPIGTTFNKFRRLVRDISKELGRDVRLETHGGEAELDKRLIERIRTPIMHLIRNAVDHGIEDADERRAQGKPAEGVVRLSAAHSGSSFLITISDDGRGIDRDRLVKKAIEMGLISSADGMSEQECMNLLFVHGLSTAARLTDVSGRGVGMDIVRKEIEALAGTIEMRSVKGQGTTFVLKLPLTLAIIDGLLFTIGANHFVLPLSSVDECIEIHSMDVNEALDSGLVTVRGHKVPFINLRRRFGITDTAAEFQQVLITSVDDQRIGFLVDTVIGKHQSVIKPIGRLYQGLGFVSGATILGDGTIAMILDAYSLMSGKAEGRAATPAQL